MLKSIILCVVLIAGALAAPVDHHKSSARGAYADFFNNIEWIERDGETALSINHKWYSGFDVDNSFRIIEEAFSSDSRWDNPKSLYAQYHCHVLFAPFKNPWNIEPHRTATSWLSMIMSKCNPRYMEARYQMYLESK